ncbi:hypothetical protein ABI59_13700 [Acidobacteria bacterium Mor1]|nr:hypothetical protein ABI59_13700 [Acidobacteria bacterium Mor1]
MTQLAQRLPTGVRIPWWIWLGGALLAIWPLAGQLPTLDSHAAWMLAFTLRLLIEGAAHLWAAARAELPARLRLALKITGATSLISAGTGVLDVIQAVGGPALLSETLSWSWLLGSYLMGTVALLVFPWRPSHATQHRLTLPLDVLITSGGFIALQWILVTAPAAAQDATEGAANVPLIYGLAQAIYLVGLNVLVLRGRAVPSRRAFWWFVIGQALYIPVTLFIQLELPLGADEWLGDLAYFAGVIPTLMAMVWMRHDAITDDAEPGPSWLRDFSPLPALVGLFLGIALITALLRDQHGMALQLAIALAVIAVLAAVRSLLSSRQNALLLRVEAERERLYQRERKQLVERLAGGVAHELNNALVPIIGNAELALSSHGTANPRKSLEEIRFAGERAARLTQQLLRFSGRQLDHKESMDLGEAVLALRCSLEGSLHRDVSLELDAETPLPVRADRNQVARMVEELVENAVRAMPAGGRIRIRAALDRLERPSDGPGLPVPPGDYATITVEDDGRGIEAGELERIFQPFYSGGSTGRAGMGLAAIQGTMGAHGGGVALKSRRGAGTTAALYFPLRQRD